MSRLFQTTAVCIPVSLLLVVAGPTNGRSEELELLPPITATESADVATEVTSDEVLSQDVPSYGSWWAPPTGWFNSAIWDFGVELGINGSEGNSQSFSIVTSMSAKRETDASTLAMKLNYGKTNSNGFETQHYALFDGRWDLNLSPQWFLYSKSILEYDEFKAFDIRLIKSGGLGYHFVKNDRSTLTSRFGAGASREFGGPDDDWVPEANFGADVEHRLTARQKFKLTLDYFPAWEDFQEYRIIADANWEILLDEATNLSLKLGAIDRYDSTPSGGRQSSDIDYYVTLLWKL